jgi:predicted  nucleic acid-binding Zn-ribbon protein
MKMGFKKLTEKELVSAEYENLIGLARKDDQFGQEITDQTKKFIVDSTGGLNTGGIQSEGLRHEGKKIPIRIENIDQIESDLLGKIQKINRHSTLLVGNPSASERLWNIVLELNDDSEPFQIGEIAPNKEWKTNLTNDEPINTVPLLIRQLIGRENYPTDINAKSELLLDKNGVNTLFITLFAKNQTNIPFKNIEIVKDFPSALVRFNESKTNAGIINQERNKIKWILPELAPNTQVVANIKFQMNPKAVQTGIITANFQYLQSQDATSIKSFRASAKIAQFINVAEQDENPGFWDCSLDIANRSEIIHSILSAELLHHEGSSVKSLAKVEKAIELNPFEEKTLLKTILHQQTQPNLSKSVDLVPLYTFQHYSKCIESFNDEKFDFLDITAQKTFSVDEIKSFESSSFISDLKVQNLSSIPLNHLLIYDTMPAGFSFGDLSSLTVTLKEKSIRLDEYKKASSYSSAQDEIDTLEKQILDLQTEVEAIEKQQSELASIIKSIDPIQTKTLIESLKADEQAKSVELQTYSANQTNLKIKLENIQKSVENSQKQIDSEQNLLNDLISRKQSLENLAKFEDELKSKDAQLKELQNQKKNLDDQIQKIDSVAEPAVYTETSQKLEGISKQISELSDSIQRLKSEISNTQKQQKSKENPELLGKKIEEQNTKVARLTEEFLHLQNDLKTISTELENIDNTFKQKDSEIAIIKAEITQKQGLLEKYNSSQSLASESQTKIKAMEVKIAQNRFRKDLLVKTTHQSNSIAEITTFIMNMYKEASDLSDFVAFDIIKVETETESHLLIQISNIEKLLSAFNENDLISVSYPVDAIRPKNDVKYDFPTKIFYLGHEGGITKEYNLPAEKCPHLNVLHLRKRISLGKIVDNYHEASKFAVTILVRNPGKTPINNIEILDSLPVEAEIFNAVRTFEERSSSGDLKQIAWQISHLAPFEETEISYLVDLHGKVCDLNAFNLVFQ